MNKNIFIILVSVLVLLGIGLCIYMIANSAETPSMEEGTTLTVTGEGTITAAPDIATINVGVTTTSETADAAQAQNNMTMENVLDALKAMGIADKDIMTNSYSVYPQYDYSSPANTIVGYQVSNTIQITLYDIDTVGDVLGKATAAGANTAGSISFGSSMADELYNTALEEAYTAAKVKGEMMANVAGMRIKGLVSLSEGVNSSGIYPRSSTYFAADEAAGVPIETGQLTFTADVTAVYSIK